MRSCDKRYQWKARLGGSEFKVMRLSDAADAPASQKVYDNPELLAAYLHKHLPGAVMFRPDTENMVVVHLNARKHIIGFEIISNGTLDTLLVHPREVFKSAIIANSAAIVLAHNHPSGDSSPSAADISVTRDLIKAGMLLKIEVLDHIVLGRKSPERPKDFSSLRELGYFYS
jgi:DNA repair protein RadC